MMHEFFDDDGLKDSDLAHFKRLLDSSNEGTTGSCIFLDRPAFMEDLTHNDKAHLKEQHHLLDNRDYSSNDVETSFPPITAGPPLIFNFPGPNGVPYVAMPQALFNLWHQHHILACSGHQSTITNATTSTLNPGFSATTLASPNAIAPQTIHLQNQPNVATSAQIWVSHMFATSPCNGIPATYFLPDASNSTQFTLPDTNRGVGLSNLGCPPNLVAQPNCMNRAIDEAHQTSESDLKTDDGIAIEIKKSSDSIDLHTLEHRPYVSPDVVPVDPEPKEALYEEFKDYDSEYSQELATRLETRDCALVQQLSTVENDIDEVTGYKRNTDFAETTELTAHIVESEIIPHDHSLVKKASAANILEDHLNNISNCGLNVEPSEVEIFPENNRTHVSTEKSIDIKISLDSDLITTSSCKKDEQSNAQKTTSDSSGKSWASLFKNTNSASSAIVINKLDKPNSYKENVCKSSEVAKFVNMSNAGISCELFLATTTVDRDPPAQELGRFLKHYKLYNKGPICPFVLRGLMNSGNWCYVNATLQALMACPPFFNFLIGIQKIIEMRTPSSTPMLDALVKFASEFSERPGERATDNKYLAFEANYVYSALSIARNDSSFQGRQEDAEEFLGVLLNHLHEETASCLSFVDRSNIHNGEKVTDYEEAKCNDANISEWQEVGPGRKLAITRTSKLAPSPIVEIFSGVLRTSVSQATVKDSASLESFFTLQLSVQTTESVNDALKQLAQEIIHRRDSVKKTDVPIYRRTCFQELPLVLILHLKYFTFVNDAVKKHVKRIHYPMDLIVPDGLLLPQVAAQAKAFDWTRKYKLFAVVFHHGEKAEGGHYTADVFHSGSWRSMDDSKFQEVRIDHVLNFQPPRVPYLLFYRRCDSFCTMTPTVSENRHTASIPSSSATQKRNTNVRYRN